MDYLTTGGGGSGSLLLPSDIDTVVLEVPLLKRRRIDLDNGALDQSLGTDELVVRGVVDDVEDTGLPRHGLASPRVVPCVQPQSPPLHVPSSDPNPPHRLVARQLRVRRLPSQLIPENPRKKNG